MSTTTQVSVNITATTNIPAQVTLSAGQWVTLRAAAAVRVLYTPAKRARVKRTGELIAGTFKMQQVASDGWTSYRDCTTTARILHAKGLISVRDERSADLALLTDAGKRLLGIATDAEILALPLGAKHDGLTVAARHWPQGVMDAAGQERIVAGELVDDVLGTPSEVVLTGDGRAYWSAWCKCTAVADDHWTRYERWTAKGREAHGYAHTVCRGILQTG